MNWVIQALFLPFLLGAYNLALAYGEKKLPMGLFSKVIFYCSVIAVAGVIATITLTLLYISNPKKTTSVLQKNIELPHIIITAILIIIAETWLTYTYEKGSTGIIFAIACMQLFVVLIGGIFLFEDKINYKIIIALIATFCSISYASYQSELIKKKK
tara:strand:- start:3041 stop:3511 length:471 start_codon:yes stop_codon:yes gene_type:complete